MSKQPYVPKQYKKKNALNKRDFLMLQTYNLETVDIDDPRLQEMEGDEDEERRVLEFIHGDYHEHQRKKRRFQKFAGHKKGKMGRGDGDGAKQDSDDSEESEESDDSDEESEEYELESDAGSLESDSGSESDQDISKFELTKLLMSRMDSKQNDRYDIYRRTTINKTGIKKLTNQIFPNPLPQDLIVIMSSISKMLMGEVIEKAKDVQVKYEKKRLVELSLTKKANLLKHGKSDVSVQVADLDKAPLRPEHVRELWRLYQIENKYILPNDSYRKQGGNGDGMLFR